MIQKRTYRPVGRLEALALSLLLAVLITASMMLVARPAQATADEARNTSEFSAPRVVVAS